ncbi:hypothetical protein RND81_14G033400 [Saponaria officinalis]|uniref:Uncharacterized protein n=1 Tax=Saponaria officinalis TaxID=3572 RepID=A0AAW1GLC7_SAPOF
MGYFNVVMRVKFGLLAILILSVCVNGIVSENLGCSFQGLQLDRCLNQNGEYIFLEPCCRALNLALRAGFHCLCFVLATNTPEFTTLFSWSMSSCYISVPPMTVCRDLGTMPITLPVPPYTPPKELRSAQTNQQVPVSPPPQPVDVSSISSSSKNSSNAVKSPANLSKNGTQILHVSEEGKNNPGRNHATYVMCCYTWLLSVAIYSIVLVT